MLLAQKAVWRSALVSYKYFKYQTFAIGFDELTRLVLKNMKMVYIQKVCQYLIEKHELFFKSRPIAISPNMMYQRFWAILTPQMFLFMHAKSSTNLFKIYNLFMEY